MSRLDFGFTLEYPRKNGLFERFNADNDRVIIQTADVDKKIPPIESADLIFPCEIEKSRIVHHLPNDTRSLAYSIRLIRKPENTYDLGKLLGIKLALTERYFGGIPNDEILTRYTTFSSNNDESQKFGGIVMRLLPPFANLDANIQDSHKIIERDCAILGDQATANLGFFLNAVDIGRSYAKK